MPFPPELALATRNPGKIREILRICEAWPVRWLVHGQDGLTWDEIEETGSTYVDNALLKASTVAGILRAPAVADDSGIEVDALGGAPGPFSAMFAGEHASDEENLAMLIDRVRDVAPSERTARYRCVAAIAWPDGREVRAEGVCEGTLVLERRGSGGFGYDPAFVPTDQPDGRTATMAELSPREKDRISHRGRAFRALGALLER